VPPRTPNRIGSDCDTTHIAILLSMVLWVMKTTVEITDSLLSEAKAYARQKGISLRQLLEESLRQTLDQRKRAPEKFHLRNCSVEGEGLTKDYTWDELRGLIYEGHGG
jgi:hypothetical protein